MDIVRILKIYNSEPVKILRIIFLFFIFFAIVLPVFKISILNIRYLLFIFSIFLIWQTFFYFKFSRYNPKLKLENVSEKNLLDSLTLNALIIFTSKDSKSFIEKIYNSSSSKFIFKKIGVEKAEPEITEFSKEDVLKNALEIARLRKGEYITTADFLCSYLVMTEEKTKFLFSQKIKKEELLVILEWSKTETNEIRKPILASFWGEGIFEEWTYGWTIEAKKYMLDLSKHLSKKRAIIIGREKEFETMVRSLGVNKSVLLVGNPGSGRDSLIRFLANESMAGTLPGNLYHQKVFQFMIDSFLAGAQNQGELEARFTALVAELLHSGNIIIYLPELENILGSSSFNLDLSGALIPYLREEGIRIISTTSEKEFKKTIEQKHELLENFEVIKLDEPEKDKALKMVLEKSLELDKQGVNITFKAVKAAVEYSDEYQRDTAVPGSAIRLLEDTISSVSAKIITEQHIISKVEQKTKMAISEPGLPEKKLLLNLEKEIHKRVIGQDEAVVAVSESMRRLRTGLIPNNRPTSFLFLGPTGVGKTETAKALAQIYFGSEEKVIRLDMSEYSTSESIKRLLGSLPGEDTVRGELTDKVKENPFSLILLDEFEKSHPNIENVFLQVLEDGRLTDNSGNTFSFGNCIIIATSNAGAEFIREKMQEKNNFSEFKKDLMDKLQREDVFKPELLNRFDEIVVFKPLNEQEVKEVTRLLLSEVSVRLKNKDISADFGDDVVSKIVKEGFDSQYGARPLRRFIQDNIEDKIAEKMLQDQIKRGDKIVISLDQTNNLLISK